MLFYGAGKIYRYTHPGNRKIQGNGFFVVVVKNPSDQMSVY